MKVKDRLTVTPKCRLCLPEFSAESGDDAAAASLMNMFSRRLEEEIVSYTGEGGQIRLYTSEYTVWEEDAIRYVCIRLSARKNAVGGGVCVSRRELTCKWRGTRLLLCRATDL